MVAVAAGLLITLPTASATTWVLPPMQRSSGSDAGNSSSSSRSADDSFRGSWRSSGYGGRTTSSGSSSSANRSGGGVSVDADVTRSGGLGVEAVGTLDEAEAKRQAWMERGGGIVGGRFGFSVTHISDSDFGTSSTGGGALLGFDFIHLAPPIPNQISLWGIVSLGFEGTISTLDSDGTNITQWTVAAPIGFRVGLGGFNVEDDWNGVAFGLSWKPSVQGQAGDNAGDPVPNPAGFEVYFDFVSFEDAVNDVAQAAHFRIFGFFLPDTDETPLIIIGGFQVAWY